MHSATRSFDQTTSRPRTIHQNDTRGATFTSTCAPELQPAETEIASQFVEAAERYSENPVALNLRAMNMLYESIVKRGSLMVVPSGLADSLNLPGIMGMTGAAGLTKDAEPRMPAPVKDAGEE